MTLGGLQIDGRYARFVPRWLDLSERTLVVLTFIFFVAANIDSMDPLNIVVALTETVPVFCILLRRPADSVSLSPLDWALAVVGTVGPMFARPLGHALVPEVWAALLWMIGTVISVSAKLSLNVRFGVAPANRGVQVRGAYAFIRHPMYAGYLLMNTAYFLINPSIFNLIVYTIAWACQFGRIHREESWLKRDAVYRDYVKAVRFRFIPGLI
ncbi:MAG: methyltransferase family protein [Phenylobacterium sp.]